MNDNKPPYYVDAFGMVCAFNSPEERDEFVQFHAELTGVHAERLEDGNWELRSRDAK